VVYDQRIGGFNLTLQILFCDGLERAHIGDPIQGVDFDDGIRDEISYDNLLRIRHQNAPRIRNEIVKLSSSER
jgi:hypothetical protein